jgi:uncharacterized protein (DUF1330 family)
MTTLAVRHSVADYETWKSFFDKHDVGRRSHGATGHRVLRDGNDLLVLIEFPDAASAQAFQSDPSLRTAMQNAGVQGAPDISLRAEAEQVQY